MRLRGITTFGAALVLAVTAGCSGTPPVTEEDAAPAAAEREPEEVEEPEPAPEPEPEAEAEPETEPEPEPEELGPDEAALAYFEAFATSRPSEMATMVDHALESSPAWVYARVQTAFMAAQQQEGWGPFDAQRLRVTDTGVELCQTGPDGRRSCMDFENLTVTDGKLATFTIAGTAIEDRLFAGGTTATDGDVVVELIGAYHSVQADSLVVVVDITNGSSQPVDLNLYSAEYLTPDSRQVSAEEAVGPFDLRPGASGYAALMFPAQGVGGAVYITGWDDDYDELEWELALGELD
jgi:hypothetical protein